MLSIFRKFSRGLLRTNYSFISQSNLIVKEKLSEIDRIDELKKFVDENEMIFRQMGPIEFLILSFERSGPSARRGSDLSNEELFDLVAMIVKYACRKGTYKDLIRFRETFRALRPFNEEQMTALLEIPEVLWRKTSPIIMRTILIIECLRHKVAVEKARGLIPKIVKDVSKERLIIESNPGMYLFHLFSLHRSEFRMEIRVMIRWMNLLFRDGQSQLTPESKKLAIKIILNYSQDFPEFESRINKAKIGISDCSDDDPYTKLIENVFSSVQIQPPLQR